MNYFSRLAAAAAIAVATGVTLGMSAFAQTTETKDRTITDGRGQYAVGPEGRYKCRLDNRHIVLQISSTVRETLVKRSSAVWDRHSRNLGMDVRYFETERGNEKYVFEKVVKNNNRYHRPSDYVDGYYTAYHLKLHHPDGNVWTLAPGQRGKGKLSHIDSRGRRHFTGHSVWRGKQYPLTCISYWGAGRTVLHNG